MLNGHTGRAGCGGAVQGNSDAVQPKTQPTINAAPVGPEAQLYFGNLILYGQASVGQLTISDFHGDQWGVRAVARYFVRKNLRLDAELDFSRTDYNGTNEDVVGAAVQAMYRFDETPWAVFGAMNSSGGNSKRLRRTPGPTRSPSACAPASAAIRCSTRTATARPWTPIGPLR
ncbi:hypothetical protein FJ872_20115 [Mesorhizobium sp. B2-5-9]|uniref:hypothetical protein n=1 Tax=unclassified Mesorhizobium TaxID=325217 RepID=UPI001128083C|nr:MULTISPECIES: hypothetical protein [unclassified Mesorhizobium]TPK13734.1 hypothetical protein FJ872_20115 [Mesorhizobium sp. B2-5-9]TPK82912.1 hypothetical protein FJ936_22410 [Mesorhizobium sp. B2-4-13]